MVLNWHCNWKPFIKIRNASRLTNVIKNKIYLVIGQHDAPAAPINSGTGPALSDKRRRCYLCVEKIKVMGTHTTPNI